MLLFRVESNYFLDTLLLGSQTTFTTPFRTIIFLTYYDGSSSSNGSAWSTHKQG